MENNYKGWLITQVKQWNLKGFKFMAIKENCTKLFGYDYLYAYTIEDIKTQIN